MRTSATRSPAERDLELAADDLQRTAGGPARAQGGGDALGVVQRLGRAGRRRRRGCARRRRTRSAGARRSARGRTRAGRARASASNGISTVTTSRGRSGTRLQSPADSSGGSIGSTRPGRYDEKPRSTASRSSAEPTPTTAVHVGDVHEHAQPSPVALHRDRVVVVLGRPGSTVKATRSRRSRRSPVRRRRIARQIERLGLGRGAGNGSAAPASPASAVQQRAHVPRRAEPLDDARAAAARRDLHQHQFALVRDGRAAPAQRQRLARLQVGVRDEEPASPDDLAADERQGRQTRKNLRIVRPEPAAPSAESCDHQQDRDLPERQRTDGATLAGERLGLEVAAQGLVRDEHHDRPRRSRRARRRSSPRA